MSGQTWGNGSFSKCAWRLQPTKCTEYGGIIEAQHQWLDAVKQLGQAAQRYLSPRRDSPRTTGSLLPFLNDSPEIPKDLANWLAPYDPKQAITADRCRRCREPLGGGANFCQRRGCPRKTEGLEAPNPDPVSYGFPDGLGGPQQRPYNPAQAEGARQQSVPRQVAQAEGSGQRSGLTPSVVNSRAD